MKVSKPNSYSDLIQFDTSSTSVPEGEFRGLLFIYLNVPAPNTAIVTYIDNYDNTQSLIVSVGRNNTLVTTFNLIELSGKKIISVSKGSGGKFAAGEILLTLLA